MKKNFFLVLSLLTIFPPLIPLRAEDPYVEPGSVRLSHEVVLEGLFHRTLDGWRVQNEGLDKSFSQQPGFGGTWETEWAQNLLTEVAARLPSDLFGRVLFEAQGDYADRFWRPNNIQHHIDDRDRHLFLREAEARINRGDWFANAFSGVAHGNWRAEGDFFELYPASYPDDDYLRHSAFFGIYPERFKQNLYYNVSKRRVPQGFEAGANLYGLDGAVAYGDELSWGYQKSFYGRLSTPLRSSKLTFVYKDEDVPYSFDKTSDERKRAYALSLAYPSDQTRWLELGVLYQPFRLNRRYFVARDVNAGSGLLGSDTTISQKTTKKKDAMAARARIERHTWLKDRDYVWSLDLTHAGVVAGNKNQVDASLATDVLSVLKSRFQFIYRKPFPRGPESPFTVDWDNREASFFVTTWVFDPTPGSNLFLYNPDVLQTWNVNPQENARFALAFQLKFSDYKTTTDRQTYYNESGEILFESPAHSGAWATERPLPEVRVMARGKTSLLGWTLGFAGGESPAQSGLAYSDSTASNKPITDYYSIEGQLDRWPWALWAHYGFGAWAPEPYQHFFGESFDRLWGVGVSYKITPNTTIDTNYLAARQDDNLFVTENVGSFDEVRCLFSHRFGFIFQFEDAPRSGYRAR